MNFFSNKNMLYSILLSIGFCAVAIYTPGLNKFLAFAPLTFNDWGTVFGATGVFLLAHETVKFLKRREVI
jgi:Ca2+-transporting ATPase